MVKMELKKYRAGLGLTQQEFAAKLGISTSNYNLKECGRKRFKEDEIKKAMEIINEKYPEATVENVFFA